MQRRIVSHSRGQLDPVWLTDMWQFIPFLMGVFALLAVIGIPTGQIFALTFILIPVFVLGIGCLYQYVAENKKASEYENFEDFDRRYERLTIVGTNKQHAYIRRLVGADETPVKTASWVSTWCHWWLWVACSLGPLLALQLGIPRYTISSGIVALFVVVIFSRLWKSNLVEVNGNELTIREYRWLRESTSTSCTLSNAEIYADFAEGTLTIAMPNNHTLMIPLYALARPHAVVAAIIRSQVRGV